MHGQHTADATAITSAPRPPSHLAAVVVLLAKSGSKRASLQSEPARVVGSAKSALSGRSQRSALHDMSKAERRSSRTERCSAL